jgi:hypothetical protein
MGHPDKNHLTLTEMSESKKIEQWNDGEVKG